MFDLETGTITPNSIGSDSLKDLSPDPTGTGRRVKVNRKGQVTEIVDEELNIAPRIFRTIFQKDSGIADLASGVETLKGVEKLSRSLHQYYFTEYKWIVPAEVTRIDVQMVGGGMGYKEDTTEAGDDSDFLRWNWTVIPGETLIARVGHGMPAESQSTLQAVSQSSLRSFDESKVAITPGPASDTLPILMVVEKCPYRTFGHGGQVSGEAGQDGLILIEYYA